MSLLDDTSKSPSERELTSRTYWRSLEELAQSPAFQESLHREFPKQASEMSSAFSRRTFLSLMGASLALAGGLTGCRRPEYKILPYSKMPEDVIPGVPQHYATSMERSGAALGLIVTSHEGRPTKIEGNPDHPANLGAVDPMTEAAILELYDPDRSASVQNGGTRLTVQDFLDFADPHFAALRDRQGEGLVFLGEQTSSPSFLALREAAMQALPKAGWHVWEPINEDNVFEGTRIAFGRPLRPLYDFSRADIIVSLDSDFLTWGPNRLAETRAFTRRRRVSAPGDSMSRLYVVEGVFSITGAKADHRLRLPSSRIETFAYALGAELAATTALIPAGSPLAQALAPYRQNDFDPNWIRALARDIARHPGAALFVVGPRQSARLHALAAVLNALVGANCVSYTDPPERHGLPDRNLSLVRPSLAALVAAMQAGRVETLVLLGGNPVYDAPADLEFAAALKKVKTSIHLSLYANETSKGCTWHVPRAHALESWGDTRSANGTVSLVQPLIAPLYGGMTDSELLALAASQPQRRAYEIVRKYYQGTVKSGNFEDTWQKALHDGLLTNQTPQAFAGANAPNVPAVVAAIRSIPAPIPPASGELELVFLPHPYLYDGRYANNGWLQETPEPVTKLSWDNAALLNPATARRLGVEKSDLVRLELDGRSVEMPVWIVPGIVEGTVAVHLGYGRKGAGRVGNKTGHDVYPLRTQKAMDFSRGLKVSRLGRKYPLVTMQDHWSMEGRPLVREASLEEFGEHPDFAQEKAGLVPEKTLLWQEPNKETGAQWGMAIDLGACIGCHACVVACQAENNTPIVGKTQVGRGREMQWLRVDRYFAGPEADPQMVFQPIPCMHCETAPCEQVCPVAATTHSPEGINEMTYNRCIGTRYCSNNCPYKVRRFNFFDYTSMKDDVEKMGMNPNVTVRMRGVMEKCSYCVQRINRARIQAKNEGRPLRTDEFTTACAQACPAEAITFGNINDPQSKVLQFKRQPRNYTLLNEINTRARTSYLALVRNPNPERVS